MKLKRLINHASRLHDMRFLPLTNDQECLLIAAEDKKVSVYAFNGEDTPDTAIPPYAVFAGHSNRCEDSHSIDTDTYQLLRVKAIDLLTLEPDVSIRKILLVTVSSDGLINLHDTSVLYDHTPSGNDVTTFKPIGSYDTNGTRLTCVTFAEDRHSLSSPLISANRISEEKENDAASSNLDSNLDAEET